jgi:hypothetical protein
MANRQSRRFCYPRKKGGDARACPCGTPGRHKGNSPKTVMTALGAVVVWRAYFACRGCGLGGYSVDRWLGLEGYLTRGPPG